MNGCSKANMIEAVEGLLKHVNSAGDKYWDMAVKDGQPLEAKAIFSSTMASHFLDTAILKGREAGIPVLNIVEGILLQSNLTFEISEIKPS